MPNNIILILAPLILANTLHMVFVKKNLLQKLAIPIWGNAFGANKTWRGFAVLPPLNGLLSMVFGHFFSNFGWFGDFSVGLVLGFAYLLFELPNSFLKRRAGIPPGGSATQNAWFFALLDKSDSSLGVSLTSGFIFGWSFWQVLWFFLGAVFCHSFFSWLLVLGRLKSGF